MNWWYFEKQTYNTTYIYLYLLIYIYISIDLYIYIYKYLYFYISIYPFFNLFHLSHSHDTCPWFVGNKLTFLHNVFIVVGFVPGIIRYYEYKPTDSADTCWPGRKRALGAQRCRLWGFEVCSLSTLCFEWCEILFHTKSSPTVELTWKHIFHVVRLCPNIFNDIHLRVGWICMECWWYSCSLTRSSEESNIQKSDWSFQFISFPTPFGMRNPSCRMFLQWVATTSWQFLGIYQYPSTLSCIAP